MQSLVLLTFFFKVIKENPLVKEELKSALNPRKTRGGDVFHQARGFLTITLEVIKVHSRNLLTFPKI